MPPFHTTCFSWGEKSLSQDVHVYVFTSLVYVKHNDYMCMWYGACHWKNLGILPEQEETNGDTTVKCFESFIFTDTFRK